MKTITITTHSEYEKMRLDRFVMAQFPNLSRSRVQKLIESGAVKVNGNTVRKHYFLRAEDVVEMDEELMQPEAEGQEWWKNVPEDPVEVLFEDDEILVANKPSGLVVHAVDARDARPSLAAWFVMHMGGESEESREQWLLQWEGISDANLRPGIVHRLDKPVTGVIVLAKTPEVAQVLKAEFQERRVEKEYRAVVYGVPAQETGDIRFALARSKTKGGKMAAKPEHEEGRDAWTSYQVLQNIHDRYAELSVFIHTGRTHQIRAHLAAIDHPIVGDHMYGSDRYPVYKKSDHLFLHAYRLQFTHPVSGERVEYTAPVPAWFELFSVSE